MRRLEDADAREVKGKGGKGGGNEIEKIVVEVVGGGERLIEVEVMDADAVLRRAMVCACFLLHRGAAGWAGWLGILFAAAAATSMNDSVCPSRYDMI